MNIKAIVDKIPKEADVQVSNYSVADRLVDVNQEYLVRVEKAVQIGSRVPISKAEANSETFSVVDGSQTFTRTIKDAPIQRVDFMPTGSTRYEKVDEDATRQINGYRFADTRFFANEKQIFVEDGVSGTLRVTYARGNVTLFTQADYDNVTPPSPDWLPEVFHQLLWLAPAIVQAGYYKPDRLPILRAQFERLDELFNNHYGRDSAHDSEFDTGEDDGCFGGGRNNR